MRQQAAPVERSFYKQNRMQVPALQERANDLLSAIAVLGLLATIVDGEADYREVEKFTGEFRKRFALSRVHSMRLIGAALRQIKLSGELNIIDCACDTLNEHLNSSQKLGLFEALAEILIADGKIHEGEEFFLDYIARRLQLEDYLEKAYPIV